MQGYRMKKTLQDYGKPIRSAFLHRKEAMEEPESILYAVLLAFFGGISVAMLFAGYAP